MPKKKLRPLKGAPYVEVVKDQLGDKHLDPVESNVREREKTLQQVSKHKIHGQAELEDPARRFCIQVSVCFLI